jgi:heavy metal translocating P-type ATPase
MPDAGATPASAHEVLVVDGMFCASCAAAVEATLRRQPGVLAAQAQFAADAAVVEWDPRATSLDAIRAAVSRLGYPTRLLSEPDDPGQRRELHLGARLAVAVFCGMWSMLALVGLYFGEPAAETARWLAISSGLLAAPALLWSGIPFYVAGWRTLRARAPGVDALILLGTIGAVAVSLLSLALGSDAVYFDTALVLVTLQLVARLIDRHVRADVAERVRGLLRVESAPMRRIATDGRRERVAADAIALGDAVVLGAGEQLAVDGVISQGSVWIDRARLTGESQPLRCRAGAAVWAGDRVRGGEAVAQVRAVAGKRRIDALAAQIRRVLTQKPVWQARVDRLARFVLPVAAIAALLGAMLALSGGESGLSAASRALAVFVIACPCALSLAVPMATLRAMGAASKLGAVVRDQDALQRFRQPDLLLVDKTGTLTEGAPTVVEVLTAPGTSESDLWAAAAAPARASEHPLAQAIAARAPRVGVPEKGRAEVLAGKGVVWEAEAGTFRLGSRAWLASLGVATGGAASGDTEVHLARGASWLGAFRLRDAPRPGIEEALAELQRRGTRIEIVSGDRPEAVARLARALGLTGHAEQSPEDKLARVEAARAAGRRVAYCGDGINDGPALAAADIGIAVAASAGAAQAAAAVALEQGGVERLPALFALLGRARHVTSQNLIFAVAYNALALPLAVAGFVHPLVAATAMGCSALTILASAARLRVPVEQGFTLT